MLLKYSLSIFLFLASIQLQATCISGNCYNGKGTFIFKDGSKYGGTFSKGKPHGQGTYYHKDGSVYVGEFRSGMKHGLGKMTFKTKDIYTGYFEQGSISGNGKMIYVNGDVYLGEWRSGNFQDKANTLLLMVPYMKAVLPMDFFLEQVDYLTLVDHIMMANG